MVNELFETSRCEVFQSGVFNFEVVVADIDDGFSMCFRDVFVCGQFASSSRFGDDFEAG